MDVGSRRHIDTAQASEAAKTSAQPSARRFITVAVGASIDGLLVQGVAI
jgi:hypothetical protein